MKKNWPHKITLIVLFTLRLCDVAAQTGIVKGKIRNGEEDLVAATVSLGNKSTLSNYKGEFSFSMKAGTHTLIITHAGYQKIEKEIILKSGDTTSFDFIMIPGEQLGEVVTIASRSTIQRSNLNTPVPVDVFSSKQLLQTGQASLTQMLNYTVPSFNASRQLLNEPVTLRGLDPDHVLILVNGIRHHTMAWLNNGNIRGQLGRGSVGNDLNSIPFSAIEKIEILRDGASAQRGSDAIAGVMDIQLKESTGKTSIQLHTGQFYEGDGEKFVIGLNRGISLHKKGFLNFSGDFRYQAPTYRGGEYLGTVYNNYPREATHEDSVRIKKQDDDSIQATGFNRLTPVSNVGITKVSTYGFGVNGGYRISKNSELYWTVLMNERRTQYEGAYRFPKEQGQVNNKLYPDGFKARINTTTFDVSAIAGAKGEMKKNWHWMLSSAFGQNSVNNNVSNTNNASQTTLLGKNAPTSFNVGTLVFNQLTNNLAFTKNLSKAGSRIKSGNLGLGAEWRLENYQREAGEEASWKNYDKIEKKRDGGSQSFAGIPPEFAVNENRNIVGIYIDLETEIDNHILFDVAARYEHYSDHGGNLAGKMAVHYRFSDKLSLRGSISNGFRAPSLQQYYSGSISNVWANSGNTKVPAIRGIFPGNHLVAKAFNISPLEPEKSINLSAGFAARIFNRINMTVDAYWIEIKNRIVLSRDFDSTNATARTILQNFNDSRIDKAAFFINAIQTRTKGLDIILNGNWNIHKANIDFSLAANFSSTRLSGEIGTIDKLPIDRSNTNGLFNIEEKTRMENGQPGEKIILSVTYKKGKTGLLIRNTYFGQTATAPVFTKPTRIYPETFSSKILTDISLNYLPKAWVMLTAGVNNVFNVYPDRLKNLGNTVEGILIYSNEASPFGFNGGYYYLGLSFNF